jgi:hypothetical protein
LRTTAFGIPRILMGQANIGLPEIPRVDLVRLVGGGELGAVVLCYQSCDARDGVV